MEPHVFVHSLPSPHSMKCHTDTVSFKTTADAPWPQAPKSIAQIFLSASTSHCKAPHSVCRKGSLTQISPTASTETEISRCQIVQGFVWSSQLEGQDQSTAFKFFSICQ